MEAGKGARHLDKLGRESRPMWGKGSSAVVGPRLSQAARASDAFARPRRSA